MRRISLILALLTASVSAHAQAWSTFLDTSRAITWQGNVGFTITNYTTPCATQPSLVAGSGNAAANSTAIQNALASCDPTHNVVNLPAGTYYINEVSYPGAPSGAVVLRGAGSSAPGNVCSASSTCLILSGNGACDASTTGIHGGICMSPTSAYGPGNAIVAPGSGARQCAWTAGYSQGTTSITLNSCGTNPQTSAGLVAGQTMVLDQANDLTDNGGDFKCDTYTTSQAGGAPACTANDGSPGTNIDGRPITISAKNYTMSQKQIVVIQSVSGSGTGPYTVTISPGVYFNNIHSGANPGAWFDGQVKNEGLENVYLDATNIGASCGVSFDCSSVGIVSCYQCWVTGVSSYNAQRAHIFLNETFGAVVRNNYLFQSHSHSTVSYGVEFEQTSADLVENNIIQQTTDCIMVGNTSGSVVGYNFCIGSTYTNPNYLQNIFSSHNAGNDMDLWEGNNFPVTNTDDTWGSSDLETYFREFQPGYQHGFLAISSFTGTSGTLTFTTLSQNPNTPRSVTLYGFTSPNTGLNGQTVSATSGTSNSFQAAVTGSGYSSGPGSGSYLPVYNTTPFINRSFSRNHNIIGSVLGQASYHTNYEAYATSTTSGTNQSLASVSIYDLGGTGVASSSQQTCNSPPGTGNAGCDSLVRPTLMRWGNYDTVNAATRWNSTEAAPAAVQYVNANFTTSYFNTLAQTLPASLYYNSVPPWWPSGKNWPPIGPDVTTGNVGVCSGGTYSGAQATLAIQCTGGTLTAAWANHVTSIPAQDCYLNVMGGSPDGSGLMLGFNPATCFQNVPLAPATNLFAGDIIQSGKATR